MENLKRGTLLLFLVPHLICKKKMRTPFLLSFFFISALTSASAHNSLSVGSSLSVDAVSDVLVSQDNTFTCGFHKVGENAYTFSIWFTNSVNKTVVWTANRDRPVNGHRSTITLGKDGILYLADVDGTIVWSSNTSSTYANVARLHDTGNLVLDDPEGNIIWQSFDSPTDTLLPTQPITKRKQLVSARDRDSLSSGYYSFFFDNDNVLKLMYDGPEVSSIYWPNPDYKLWEIGRTSYNSSRYGVLDEQGKFVASDRLAFNSSDLGYGIRRRLTFDYDGNLRLYSLNETSGIWSISWQALPELCLVHGLCGRNGICIRTPEPQCTCPPGYETSDASDWRKGCKPRFNISCKSHQQLKFVELPQTDFWGFDLNYTPSIALVDCKKLCRDDCACQAIVYKMEFRQCYTKFVLFNGKTTPTFQGSAYLKLPESFETSKLIPREHAQICSAREADDEVRYLIMYMRHFGKSKWVYFYGFVSAFGVIEILFVTCGWWFILRKNGNSTSVEEAYKVLSGYFRKFTYRELKKATCNFKYELGRGATGAVYKGVLDDNRVVAVKKLEDVIKGEEEFWAEVSLIGRIYHTNLVPMWGFCSEGSHKILVYEYAQNGSLDKHLFNNQGTTGFLIWSARYKIAVGVAKALAYLHHECLEWVIHCDVKPENILLDNQFEPKIADFGLAKLLKRGSGTDLNISRMQGTRGYMAPEWTANLPITAKVDVYSYGVVLLEIVKGIRIGEEGADSEQQALVRELKEKLGSREESWIDDFVDHKLNGWFDRKQVMVLIEMAVSCLEAERSKRPTMDDVVAMLMSCDDEPSSHGAHISEDTL